MYSSRSTVTNTPAKTPGELLLVRLLASAAMLQLFVAFCCREYQADNQTQAAECCANAVRHDQKPVVRGEAIRKPQQTVSNVGEQHRSVET
jgi:hypothetical protein